MEEVKNILFWCFYIIMMPIAAKAVLHYNPGDTALAVICAIFWPLAILIVPALWIFGALLSFGVKLAAIVVSFL